MEIEAFRIMDGAKEVGSIYKNTYTKRYYLKMNGERLDITDEFNNMVKSILKKHLEMKKG